jgi:hypothetical protein
MRGRTNVIVWAGLLAVLLLNNGCQTSTGSVAREWSAAMRELQIVPVFPPREDMIVGDIYLAEAGPDEQEEVIRRVGYLPMPLWVASVDLRDPVAEHYSRRTTFPRTVMIEDGSDIDWHQPAGPPGTIGGEGDTGRLRLVGFPEFMNATVTGGDLSGLVPVEALALGFGAGFSDVRRVTVSVPVAESYGLPLAEVIAAMPETLPIPIRTVDLLFPEAVRQPPGCRMTLGHLRLICEVYYARVLDISCETSRRAELDASLGLATGAAFRQEDPAGRASILNQEMSGALADLTPGSALRFVAVGERAVSLRRVFERPVAIGYRGTWLALIQEIDMNGDRRLTWHTPGPIDEYIPTAADASSRDTPPAPPDP